jgi:GNAT superfamily N-acetyltransferase
MGIMGIVDSEEAVVRPAVLADAAELAACHIACWREAYAHLLSAAFLSGLDVDVRRRQWEGWLAAPGAGTHWVALVGGSVVGFAGARASRDDPPVREVELWGLYLRAAHHGCGLGQALLDAAVGDQPCSLWVAEDNPRARAFYARNGFVPDGARMVEPAWEGLAEVRLVR